MSSALLYLGICVAAYLVAIPLRKYKSDLGWFGTAQLISVTCLVFIMGMRVGSNPQVINNLDSYGIISLVFTVIVVTFSIISAHLARRLIGLDRYGHAKAKAPDIAKAEAPDLENIHFPGSTSADPGASESSDSGKGRKVSTMTIAILISVTIGIISGHFFFFKHFGFEKVQDASSLGITIGLCVLLIFVGLDLGIDGTVISNIRKVGFKILIIPLSVAFGTLVGSLLCFVILPLAFNESMAIGAGFAWYSLGAAIIMDAGFEAAGAISFMHNIMRELCAIVFVPIVAKKIGYVEAIGIPASVGMDVCLPIVEQSTNGTTTVYSFITGFTMSMSVPFLVPFFISL